ncbi:MAG: hypothetical protein R2769_14865 [Saprospiraceae bacterium]
MPITQTTLYRRGVRKPPCDTYIFKYDNKVVVDNTTNPGVIAGDEEQCGKL